MIITNIYQNRNVKVNPWNEKRELVNAPILKAHCIVRLIKSKLIDTFHANNKK